MQAGAQLAAAAAPAQAAPARAAPYVSEADSVSVTMLHCADQAAEPQRGGQALPRTSAANAAPGAPMAAPASDAALRPGTDIWGLPYDQEAAEAALEALRENYAPMNRQGSALSAAHQASTAAVVVVRTVSAAWERKGGGGGGGGLYDFCVSRC